jgi:phosphoribosylformylglycinamidine synthase
VHDVSDGGLLVALAEMAMASGIGAELDAPAGPTPHAFWFGEDQGRYVVTMKEADAAGVLDRAAKSAVPVQRLGSTKGNELSLSGERPVLVAALIERFVGWLPAYMAGGA